MPQANTHPAPDQKMALVFWRSTVLKPSPEEFSKANELGYTKIVLYADKDDVHQESRWQYIKGQWQEVKLWRKLTPAP